MGLVRMLAGNAQAVQALEDREHKEEAATIEGQLRAWNREMDELTLEYSAKADYETKYQARIAALRQAGADKIRRDAAASYERDMAALGEERQRIERVNETSELRIASQYAADVAKFSAAEAQKLLTVQRDEQQIAAIRTGYTAIQAALLKREATDLQTLHNSQGWQGVLGAPFGQAIRQNEALWREWASSTTQSHMMVRVSLEALKTEGESAFDSFAQGMGANIAHAIIYKQSIAEAMRAALVSTLESITAQATVNAIRCTALGFMDIAEKDYPGATAAFTAAGIWASVGATAGLLGRGIAPSQGGAGASAAGSAANTSSVAPGDSTGSTGAAAGASGPHVTVNVWGHVYGQNGIQDLAAALNDAVLNNDVQLTSTNTKTGVQVIR